MAITITMRPDVLEAQTISENGNGNIIVSFLNDSIDACRRARPYLYNHLTEHLTADNVFDEEVIRSGKASLFFSIIPEEMDLRKSEYLRLNQIIDKTIEVGLMNKDYTWRRTTAKTQIALWVDMITEELAIPHKWKWAQQRWNIRNLKQARSNTINLYGKIFDEDRVLACFEP